MLRRVLTKDGRSRAFINDQPVGVALLRRAGALLVEVQGQHEQIGLADPASHVACSTRSACLGRCARRLQRPGATGASASTALQAAREAIAEAERDEAWLRHAVEELAGLAPQEGEEERLANERQRLQQGERRAEAIAAALSELAPRDRRSAGPAASLRAASRALQRLVAPRQPDPSIRRHRRCRRTGACRGGSGRGGDAADQAGSRCRCRSTPAGAGGGAAVRAARGGAKARGRRGGFAGVARHACARGWQRWKPVRPRSAALEQAVRRARAAIRKVPSCWRRRAASPPTGWIARWRKELPPLRLDKARFRADVAALEEADWGPTGADTVRFLIATNPGQELGPLGRIASGGELSRLMLALKVVLSSAARRCRHWCSTRWTPTSAAPPRRRSANG